MKHFFLGLAFAMCALVGLAQPRITVGEPYPKIKPEKNWVTKGLPILKYFFSEGNNIVAVYFDLKNITIQTLDANSLQLKTTKVYNDLPTSEKVIQMLGPFYKMELVVELKDHRYFFYSTLEDDRYKLYFRELYFASASLSEPKLIMEFERESKRFERDFDMTDTRFIFSSDYSILLIKHDILEKRKDDPKQVGVHVFRSDMTEMWQGTFTPPHDKAASNYFVSNRGEVFVLDEYGPGYAELKDDVDNSAAFHHELHKLTHASAQFAQQSTFSLDVCMWPPKIMEGKDGSRRAVAKYNRDGKHGTVNGFIYFDLDARGMPVNIKKHEIPFALLKQNAYRKEQKKLDEKEKDDNAENESLRIVKTVEDADGSLLIVAEEHDSGRRDIGDVSIRYAIFRDLIVTKLSPTGDLLWMRKMAKEQIGGWMGSEGHHFMADDHHYYFLFPDWPTNKNLPDSEPPLPYGYGGDGVLSVFKVSRAEGTVQRIELTSLTKANGVPIYMFDMSNLAIDRPDLVVIEFLTPNNKKNLLLKVEMGK